MRSGFEALVMRPAAAGTRWALLLGVLTARSAGAQASPYLPTDDPRAPLIEHLIARGDLADPTPLNRPLRRADLVALLRARGDSLSARLATALADPAGDRWARLSPRAGAQGFTQGRRDLLQAGADGGVRGYAELGGEAAAGPFVAVIRGAAENRLKYDPDWPDPGRVANADLALRVVEAYVAWQPRWGSIHVGQIARNWGPLGVPGVALSDAGYPRPDIGIDIGSRAIRFAAVATRMQTHVLATGERIERYLIEHRLTVRPTGTLSLAAWESAVVAGQHDQLDGITRAVVPLLVVPGLFAARAHRNEMIGGDLSWRPTRRVRLEAELAIDDWNFDASNPYPQRWAGAVTGAGALGAKASWMVTYATASSLAFRTFDPDESFTDRGVGLGRLFPDNEVLSVTIGVPVRDRWLLSPRAAILRQGEGRIQDPFPTPAEAAAIPERFIGTVATSYWLGAGVAGWEGPLAISGEAGLRHTTNAAHVAGAGRTSLEARFTATLGLTLQTRPH